MTGGVDAFKSIIFFGSIDQRSMVFKEKFAQLNFIKVFNSNHVDEIQQVIDMSVKTVVLSDNDEALALLKTIAFSEKTGLSRRYHLDWDNKFNQREVSALGVYKITVLKPQDQRAVVEKLELYLFGRVNVLNKDAFIEPKAVVNPTESKNFFTFLELQDGVWKVIISSHEKEDDVSQIIGKNWDDFLADTLSRAHLIKDSSEVAMWQKPYCEIIFPYFVDGVIKNLSIVHIPQDQKLAENKSKILSFLQGLSNRVK